MTQYWQPEKPNGAGMKAKNDTKEKIRRRKQIYWAHKKSLTLRLMEHANNKWMYITVTLFLNVRGNAEEKSIEERSGERESGRWDWLGTNRQREMKHGQMNRVRWASWPRWEWPYDSRMTMPKYRVKRMARDSCCKKANVIASKSADATSVKQFSKAVYIGEIHINIDSELLGRENEYVPC